MTALEKLYILFKLNGTNFTNRCILLKINANRLKRGNKIPKGKKQIFYALNDANKKNEMLKIKSRG